MGIDTVESLTLLERNSMHSQFTQQILDSVPGFDFVAAHFECERDRYSPDNPTGFVNLGSAQNFLMSPLVHDKLPDVQWALEDASYQSLSLIHI